MLGFLQLLIFPMELLLAVTIYVIPLRMRRQGVWRCLLSLAAIFLVEILWMHVYPWVAGRMYIVGDGDIGILFWILSYFLFYFVFLLGILLCIWYSFDISLKEAVLCVTMGYATEHIAYCIRLLINGATDSQIAESLHLLYFLIHFGVYLIFYFFFAKKMVQRHHYETDAMASLWMTLVTLFIVLLMSLAASFWGFTVLHGIYGLVCCLFVMINQRNYMSNWHLQKEMAEQQQIFAANKAQYEMSKENIERINRKCHDLKHQIAGLRNITDADERCQIVDSIEKSVMIYDAILHTGNPILDTVLTEKSLICQENGIRMHGIIDGKLLFFMDAIDIYTLFGNALDNAIEANRKVEKEKRCISILIHEKVNLIFIQIENPYTGALQMKHGLPQTSKQDKHEHGFGMESIQTMAEKYGGFLKLETGQDIFVLRITIPQSR